MLVQEIGAGAQSMTLINMIDTEFGNAAGMLLVAARRFGERTAVLEAAQGRTASFAGLCRGALALAHRLRSFGIRPGDRVAILLERGVESATSYFGVLACGGVA